MPPKILCVTRHNPAGPDNGGVVRTRNIFQLLSRLGQVRLALTGGDEVAKLEGKTSLGGFEVAAVVQFQPTPPWSFADRLRNEFDGRFLNIDHWQASGPDQERLRRLAAEHDLVWVHNLQMANHCGLWRWPRSVLDIDDIPSTQYRSEASHSASFLKKLRWRRQVWLWRRREGKLLERFDALCVCSEADRKLMRNSDRVFCLPNGFTPPTEAGERQPATPPRVGFIGNFRHPPNRQGMEWFTERTWPLILERAPGARLRVVGAAGEEQNWPAHSNIDILGWMTETHNEMATWALTVVPIFTGGGTRVKIAEAFSRRCPVVATTLGARGYEVTDGRELLIADSARDFSAKCVQILNQPALGETLAENAWRKFNEKWTWEAQAGTVERIVEKILSARTDEGGS